MQQMIHFLDFFHDFDYPDETVRRAALFDKLFCFFGYFVFLRFEIEIVANSIDITKR